MVLFITGIDTDAGKSYATGILAKRLLEKGISVITQKFIQTGNHNFSEDIDVHRRLMKIPMQPRDIDHTTAPLILSYPASPDLAAKIDGVDLDYEKAARSTEILATEYDCVLIEGAGGVMVPLKDDYLTIDYIHDHDLPVVVVTNGNLGSINHTLLTLKVLETYGVEIHSVVYNSFFDSDTIICEDTKRYIKNYLNKYHPDTRFYIV